MRLKRLIKKSDQKTKKSFQKSQADDSLISHTVGAKKRIKQKSLATIVAKNLEKAKLKGSAGKPLTSILKKPSSSLSLSVSDNGTISKESKQSKSNEHSTDNFNFSNKNQSSKPPVSFSKPSKESEGKVVLFKKRKIDTGGPKKSLSSIFNVSDSTVQETKLLKSNESSLSQVGDKLKTAEQCIQSPKRKFEFIKTYQNEESNSKKFKKLSDKFEKNKKKDSEFKKASSNQPTRHSGGKISSLFGNNPEIPSIGQRLVKPVNEKVFTAEKFSDLNVHAFSVSNLEQNLKITTMTTVQKKAIPVILTGQDVLIRSQTGSGKTLSYALPIIETLQSIRPKLSRNCGTKALVVVPTRELALQSYECFLKLIKVCRD